MNVQGEKTNSNISDTRATGGTCELIGNDNDGVPATIEAHDRKRKKVAIAKSDEKSRPQSISGSCIASHENKPSALSDSLIGSQYFDAEINELDSVPED